MELNKNSIRILKCLKKKGYDGVLLVNQIKVLTDIDTNEIMELLVYLWKNELVRVASVEQPKLLAPDYKYQITTKCKIFLSNRFKNNLHKWYPYVIPTIALVISVFALLK